MVRGMDGQRRAEVRAQIDGFVVSWAEGVSCNHSDRQHQLADIFLRQHGCFMPF